MVNNRNQNEMHILCLHIVIRQIKLPLEFFTLTFESDTSRAVFGSLFCCLPLIHRSHIGFFLSYVFGEANVISKVLFTFPIVNLHPFHFWAR